MVLLGVQGKGFASVCSTRSGCKVCENVLAVQQTAQVEPPVAPGTGAAGPRPSARGRSPSGAVHAGRSRPLLRITVYCAGGGATARCDRHFRRGLDVSSRRDGGEAGAGGSAEGDGGPGRRPRGRGERPRPALLLPPGHGGLPRRAEPRLPPAPRRHAGWAGPAGRERAAGGGSGDGAGPGRADLPPVPQRCWCGRWRRSPWWSRCCG